MALFDTVLIANRGEIACRIIRTLGRLGVRSVAIYSEVERQSRHVLEADRAICVGPAATRDSYLNIKAVLEAARASGAQAIHPGYGFLSENPAFAEACEAQGVTFIGPTPAQIRAFGLKHTARELAEQAGLPLLPGSGLLDDAEHACREARRVGFPVMLKSSAGGGGIGMQRARDEAELRQVFEAVQRLSRNNFGDASLFVERFIARARHLEVQLFGDGQGNVIALGERDCSAQRRNQKVIEETPAPALDERVRKELARVAVVLGRSVGYRSAGTVEFVYDCDLGEFYFLEVNTRLQVEHGVTEAVYGVDLVEWMVRTAAGEPPDLARAPTSPQGHAIEARVYAEDPARDFRPSAGLITQADFPPDARIDGWVERGTEISPFYDPLLAKVIVHGADRSQALARFAQALDLTRIAGIETNVAYLRALARHPLLAAGELTTQTLKSVAFATPSIEVESAGTFSIIVDHPGRLGYWEVGVPPSGPMDSFAHRLGNRIVGNPEGAPGLELTMSGPTLKFATEAVIALTGARMPATLDGEKVAYHAPLTVRAGQTLKLGAIEGAGCRTYLALAGGFDVPEYLGSRTTFTLGGFGGHGGRALRRGDVLHIASEPARASATPAPAPAALVPEYVKRWEIGVLYGPHGAPDFFTPADIETLFSTDWEVHYNSSRTGVRLIGPKPKWARPDGGEAGLHPSNIHDVAYAIGAIDFTGDMPIILGPDGPSLGGFVCPATVIDAELWKVGQLRPGDRVRFVPLSDQAASELDLAVQTAFATFGANAKIPSLEPTTPSGAVQRELNSDATDPAERVVYRRAGDGYLLVEYGPLVLDLRLRFRVHALMQWIQAQRLPGIVDLTPGIRSLQIHYDHHALRAGRLLDILTRAESELGPIDELEVPTRRVRLPLSWDDPQTRVAIQKYTQSVRPDAPWCPSNIEFIRRINGLGSEQDVHDIVFGASYLVLGLGDVYLGAPVATPVDPRHRLVTTKYNPARTWTPENAVGIGGAYLCIYGMEGPGGYQFVGRTLQVYNRFRSTKDFAPDTPWLLRHFDQIQFYPVSADELLEQRAAFLHGKVELRIESDTFRLRDYQRFLGENAASIGAFKARQQAAFEAERQRWIESGQSGAGASTSESSAAPADPSALPPGTVAIDSPVPGSVWKVAVAKGQRVKRGDPLLIVESMKMEVPVEASDDGTVVELYLSEGNSVAPGQRLALLKPE
jgi:urea carboxylase